MTAVPQDSWVLETKLVKRRGGGGMAKINWTWAIIQFTKWRPFFVEEKKKGKRNQRGENESFKQEKSDGGESLERPERSRVKWAS